jgi:hypothetical protein
MTALPADPSAAHAAPHAAERSSPDPVDELLGRGEFPRLAAALGGPDGAELREELLRVLYRGRRRATRRQVTRVARLQGPDYDEVVLMTDISTTGVRLLVQRDCPLDVNKTGALRLVVNASGQVAAFPLELVRVCANEGKHLDVACRFLEPAPWSDALSSLRSLIFETHWAAAEAEAPGSHRG